MRRSVSGAQAKEQGKVSSAMFVGRREYLRDFLDPQGPTVLYGGRRLGKSSIFQQVKTAFEQQSALPGQNVAVYIDANNIVDDASIDTVLIPKISGEINALLRTALLPQSMRGRTRDMCTEFANGIRRLLSEFPDHHVLVLIDEADLLLQHLNVSNERSLSWVCDFVSQWPGPHLRTETSRLYCCCVVSAALPASQTLLADGCEMLIMGSSSQEALVDVVSAYVDDQWGWQPPVVRRYIVAGIIDMASGRRMHAAAALDHIAEEWETGIGRQPDWCPQWNIQAQAVQRTRAILSSHQLTAGWLGGRLTTGKEHEPRDDVIVSQLWCMGLWMGQRDQTGLWTGLTALAYTALQPDEATTWITPYLIPSHQRHSEATRQLRKLLGHLVEIRNRAAHLGWFTRTEYEHYYEMLQAMEDELNISRLFSAW